MMLAIFTGKPKISPQALKNKGRGIVNKHAQFLQDRK